MLEKAKKNLNSGKCHFVLGDVGQLPFLESRFSVISCFGGLNSFPDVPLALREIYRVLTADGRVRGSALLMPASQWRQKKIRQWIQEGYQSQEITTEKLKSWIHMAGFQFSRLDQFGDVLLFEITKKS